MKNLLERVAHSIRGRNLFRRGERLLVAVSGGVDSMVLLHLLHNLAAQSGWKLSVAHFNHRLRGRASDADEQFVRRTAMALGLAFYAGRGDVKSFAKHRRISIEMAARELRHQFLAQTARRLKCPDVAVAHHADDQVELFFLRLLRGAGGEGLGGMKWRSVSPASKQVRIVRPMLDVGREELEQFARENKIRFREDTSNASHEMLRNRVRHELLPLLRKSFQPALNRTVLRLMDVVGAEAEAVGGAARAWLAAMPGGGVLAALPVGVQRQVVQQQLQRLKIPADFDLIESLRLQTGKAVSINPRRSMVCDEAGLVKAATPPSRVFRTGERRLNLARQASISFAGLELDWKFMDGEGFVGRGKQAAAESFDAAKVGRKVVLRHWRPGDRSNPSA